MNIETIGQTNLSIYNKKSNCQFMSNLSPFYNNKKKDHSIAQFNLRQYFSKSV